MLDSPAERDAWEREVRAVVDKALAERFPRRALSRPALALVAAALAFFALGLLIGALFL